MDPALGKRAVNRRETRRALRRAAMELFLARGFDTVTTTEIAVAAGVAPATLFNHFDTKEDLFFGQVLELERALVEVVRSCPSGGSLLLALRSHVLWELTAGKVDTDPEAVGPFHHQVAGSPRLQARERELYDRRELVLTEAIAAATEPDAGELHARFVARQYIAAEQLIAGELRHRLGNEEVREILSTIDPFVDEVFTLLADGVGTLPKR